jgi:hypothetical protein
MFEYSRSFPAALLIAVGMLAATATFAAERPNIVIMAWDGAGYKNVEVLLENNQLPKLARLVNLGAAFAFLRSPLHGPTYTIPIMD